MYYTDKNLPKINCARGLANRDLWNFVIISSCAIFNLLLNNVINKTDNINTAD